MNYKNLNAAKTTVTRDMEELIRETGNVYQTIAILSKRANQINVELKEELQSKLQEFTTAQDNLEEVFENREQIEISKIYERMPKPHAYSVEEFKTGKTYWRFADENGTTSTTEQ